MKTFPTNFTTEKNKKIGASPVWIMKCPFPSTGTIYISDQVFTVAGWNGGITTKSWVNGWGEINEDISGDRALTKVSSFDFNCLIDTAATDIETILWTAANNVETTDCELYLWFRGLNASTDPPQLFWAGNIIDWSRQGELNVNIRMVDISVRLDKYIGTKINATDYPNADPDEIGKTLNIIYGSPKKVRCHAVKAGAVSSLTSDITATVPGNSGTLVISDASRFPSSGAFTFQTDEEQIRIASRSGDTLTLASSGARGYGGTTATPHNKGANVFEVLTEFIYMVADHKVKTINDVFVDDIKQVTGVTKYTGQTGDAHASYPGKAVIAFAAKAVVKKQVNLSDSGHTHAAPATQIIRPTATTDGLSSYWSKTGVVANIADQSDATSFKARNPSTTYTGGYMRATFPAWSGGTPSSVYLCITHKSSQGSADPYYCYIKIGTASASGTQLDISDVKVTQKISNGTTVPTYIYVNLYQQGAPITNCECFEVWLEVETSGTGSASANIGGLSTADVVIGATVNVNVDGYQDDASGTITGTANRLIDRPDWIIKHFLYTYISWALANFSTNAASFFSSKSYTFAVLINEYKTLKYWLARMSFQCRCYFRFAAGKSILTWRPDSVSSSKTITASMIAMSADFKTTRELSREPLTDILNRIQIHYDRDWSKTGEDSYTGLTLDTDSTSITRYGEKETPSLFDFDFITASAMAADLGDFYIARYKARKKSVKIVLFLDNSELEFADGITVTPEGSLLCEVKKVNIQPGSGLQNRNDKITIYAGEY
jgi:hypothetical protein